MLLDRLRRLVRVLRGNACPICGTRFQPTGLAQHLDVMHTPAELRQFLETMR
jgi:hypothetical protein